MKNYFSTFIWMFGKKIRGKNNFFTSQMSNMIPIKYNCPISRFWMRVKFLGFNFHVIQDLKESKFTLESVPLHLGIGIHNKLYKFLSYRFPKTRHPSSLFPCHNKSVNKYSQNQITLILSFLGPFPQILKILHYYRLNLTVRYFCCNQESPSHQRVNRTVYLNKPVCGEKNNCCFKPKIMHITWLHKHAVTLIFQGLFNKWKIILDGFEKWDAIEHRSWWKSESLTTRGPCTNWFRKAHPAVRKRVLPPFDRSIPSKELIITVIYLLYVQEIDP